MCWYKLLFASHLKSKMSQVQPGLLPESSLQHVFEVVYCQPKPGFFSPKTKCVLPKCIPKNPASHPLGFSTTGCWGFVTLYNTCIQTEGAFWQKAFKDNFSHGYYWLAQSADRLMSHYILFTVQHWSTHTSMSQSLSTGITGNDWLDTNSGRDQP